MFTTMAFTKNVDNVFDMLDRAFPASDKIPQLRGFRADIRNEEDHYLIEAELPGFDKNDITLDLTNGILTIKAERRSAPQEKAQYIRKERYYGAVARSFELSGITEENISAVYENGVLALRLPKEPPVVPEKRSIVIQ